MTFLVRHAEPGEGAAISRIFIEAARVAWASYLPVERLAALQVSGSQWEGEMANEASRVLVAERADRLLGYASTRPSQDADSDPLVVGELDYLFTLPEVWGDGVGRALIRVAVDDLAQRGFREVTLWTAEQNHRARRVYEATGWATDGTRRQHTWLDTAFDQLRYRRPTTTAC